MHLFTYLTELSELMMMLTLPHLIAEIEMIVASHGELNLLVLDTFQRVFSGNENSSEDVGAFISKLDKLIADYKCCVLIVHHTGHGEWR
jgi:RecA-family ATPase